MHANFIIYINRPLIPDIQTDLTVKSDSLYKCLDRANRIHNRTFCKSYDCTTEKYE